VRAAKLGCTLRSDYFFETLQGCSLNQLDNGWAVTPTMGVHVALLPIELELNVKPPIHWIHSTNPSTINGYRRSAKIVCKRALDKYKRHFAISK
jgi:hypothetical protein